MLSSLKVVFNASEVAQFTSILKSKRELILKGNKKGILDWKNTEINLIFTVLAGVNMPFIVLY